MPQKNIPPKAFHQWTDAEVDAAEAYMARLRNPTPENIAADMAAGERLQLFIMAYDCGGVAWADWQRQEYTDLMRRLAGHVWTTKEELGIN